MWHCVRVLVKMCGVKFGMFTIALCAEHALQFGQFVESVIALCAEHGLRYAQNMNCSLNMDAQNMNCSYSAMRRTECLVYSAMRRTWIGSHLYYPHEEIGRNTRSV